LPIYRLDLTAEIKHAPFLFQIWKTWQIYSKSWAAVSPGKIVRYADN